MGIIFSLLIQGSYQSKSKINHLIHKENFNQKNKKLDNHKKKVLQKDREKNKKRVIQAKKTKNNYRFFLRINL